MGQVRETNSFIQVNNLIATDRSLPLFMTKTKYAFLRVDPSNRSTWVSETAMVRYENSTTNGFDYEQKQVKPLYREHFSLSTNMVNHKIEIVGFSGAFGNLITNMALYGMQLFIYFQLMAYFVNRRLETSRYIKRNFIVKVSDNYKSMVESSP